MVITRAQARSFVCCAVDDALSARHLHKIPNPDTNVRYVGWECGSGPKFVAVWSYLPNVQVSDEEAVDLATDRVDEYEWFTNDRRKPDYIL